MNRFGGMKVDDPDKSDVVVDIPRVDFNSVLLDPVSRRKMTTVNPDVEQKEGAPVTIMSLKAGHVAIQVLRTRLPSDEGKSERSSIKRLKLAFRINDDMVEKKKTMISDKAKAALRKRAFDIKFNDEGVFVAFVGAIDPAGLVEEDDEDFE